MQRTARESSPGTVLAAALIVSAFPLVAVELFPVLKFTIAPASYLLFHNVAEFFSVMVSLSMFGIGWYTYDQSKDRHALFLSTAFLGIGLMDFMHTLANAAMPPFITPNSSNKSTQFWIAVRMYQAVVFLISAYVYPERPSRWMSKKFLMISSLLVCLLVFTGITFFPAYLPATYVSGAGLTPFKRVTEFLIIATLCAAALAYQRRIAATGESLLVYYAAAFVICIFSELPFAVYTKVFDTYNVLGHIYKVAAFFLIYYGIYRASVKAPYLLVQERTTELLKKNEELERSNRELEDFVGVASHDLQEPLRKIQTFSDRLMMTSSASLGEKARDDLNRMHHAAGRMQSLLSDLLKYSQTTSMPLVFSRFNLQEAIGEAASDLGAPCREKGGTIEISGLPEIEADKVQMHLLFLNLISNSLKYRSGEKPLIRIYDTASPSDPFCEINVQDNGIGFDERYLGKIFKPFERLHGTSSPHGGTGMGLAVCRRIVERHGGSIAAKSKPGDGSAFIVKLPKERWR